MFVWETFTWALRLLHLYSQSISFRIYSSGLIKLHYKSHRPRMSSLAGQEYDMQLLYI
jgi:hypothetical protein